MALPRLSDYYYEKKRIAHRPGGNAKQGESTKLSSKDQRNKEPTILKDFDLNQDFGPCIGITRLERWKRAQKHNLNPPLAVKDLILLNSNDKEYVESVWYSYDTLH